MVVLGDNIWILKTALYSHGRDEFIGALRSRIVPHSMSLNLVCGVCGFLRLSFGLHARFHLSLQLYKYLFVERSGVNGRRVVAQERRHYTDEDAADLLTVASQCYL